MYLIQKNKDDWKLIECGSRFITETEALYAMVKLQLLVGVWALLKWHSYLFGRSEFMLITDHQPLVTIINKKTLDAGDNKRIQRLKRYLNPYDFKTVWKRGKDNCMADALSRSPVHKSNQGANDLTQDVYESINIKK
ncbi:unnamed protein product [Lepeophtheirus salmonis]|uniref:(salmon louse) hypothetical protein n=1 Tax=Lepeophtheirus salmonis TaxID=72036 RepID=A0A7R8CKM1_LEPSM|nr:unnamed protein product [Lepeophtheirus salmonis]CAF2846631.1 unnamed protein product [Lepeophtheirus salmonis]